MTGYIKFFGLFVLVISLGFAVMPSTEAYDVEYIGDIEVDASGSEWNAIERAYLEDDAGTEDDSYFKAAYTGSEICFYFVIYDSSDNGIFDYVNIGFDESDGIVYSFARDGSGDLGTYATSEIELWGITWGWRGEVCIAYANVGLAKGSSKIFNDAYIDAFDDHTRILAWPEFDEEAELYSSGDWAPPGWCDENNDCEDDEACFKFTCFELTGECGYADNHAWVNDHEDCPADQLCVNRECTYLPASQCGYIENHEIIYYDCCENEDCAVGEECTGNICVVPAECTENADCEEYEECSIGLCVLQEGKCESNSDCSDDEYCSGHDCVDVPTGDCGYVENHLWHDYECCSNSDCGANKECADHECESVEPTCEGTVTLQFVETAGGGLRALVSGISNCDGKLVEIKEDNCAGNTVCSFTSGDEGGNCDFDSPSEEGLHLYSACIDLNGDGIKEFDQEGYVIEAEICESEGCTVSEWNDCICEEGENKGTQTGTCEDNCGEELIYDQECTCEVSGGEVGEEQAEALEVIEDAQEAINEAKEAGEDVSEAQEKLEQAHEAYDAGSYGLAKELAEDALEVATTEKEEPFELDLQLVLIVGLVVLGAVVIYLLYDKFYGKPKPRYPKAQETVG